MEFIPDQVFTKWAVVLGSAATSSPAAQDAAGAAGGLDWLDYLLLACTYLGILIGAASGILGTVTETKNEDGTLTRWGHWTLYVVAGSLVVALVSQIAQDIKARRADAAAAEKTNEQIRQSNHILTSLRQQNEVASKSLATVKRVVSKFDSVSASARMKAPFDDPAFAEYRKPLEGEVATFLRGSYATIPTRSDPTIISKASRHCT